VEDVRGISESCCAAQCCTVLCCAVLSRVVLCSVVLRCAVLRCAVPAWAMIGAGSQEASSAALVTVINFHFLVYSRALNFFHVSIPGFTPLYAMTSVDTHVAFATCGLTTGDGHRNGIGGERDI
jgi:hypothetical protein